MTREVLTIHTLDAIDVHVDRAGIGSRAYAFLIDWHIRFLAATTWFLLAIVVLGMDFKTGATTFSFGAMLPTALIYFLYHPVLEIGMRGQTPGKRWAHLRIVTSDGGIPGTGALLVRNLFRVLDSLPSMYALGLLVMLCTKDSVRIGDLAAGTIVVYDNPAPKGLPSEAGVHEGVAARVAPLLEEWLERWDELDVAGRDGIARGLLHKAGVGDHERLDSAALRMRVRGWLDESRA
jgi:uncharacterized RDD family membrane protein YckC